MARSAAPQAGTQASIGIGEREVLFGVLLMLLATVLQPMQDAIMKYLGGAVPPVLRTRCLRFQGTERDGYGPEEGVAFEIKIRHLTMQQ